jgi:hypothetical protein
MHLSQTTVTNVAGILYAAHYDETEVELLHTGAPIVPPLFGNVTPFGQSNASPFAVPLSSTFSPLPTSVTGTKSGFRQHIAWLPPSIANASGATVNASSSLNFATFSIHARHTPLSNNDPAFTVASAYPIFHATTSHASGQFFIWDQSAQSFAFRATIETNSFYIPLSAATGVANYANLRLVPEPAGAAALLVGCLMLALLGILRKRGVAPGQ